MTTSKTAPQKTFKQRVMGASLWVTSGHVGSQLLRLVSNLILTRLLVPEMFGTMAVANALMTGITLLTDVGVQQSIVQNKKGENEDFQNTAWTVQIVRSFFITLTLIAFSLIIGFLGRNQVFPEESVYSSAILPEIMIWLSLSVLINGFQTTNKALANRKLLLRRVIILDLSGQSIGVIFTIAMAWNEPSIWALVWGGIVASLANVTLSQTFLPGTRNRWRWDKKYVKELMRFGRWIVFSSIFTYLGSRGIQLIQGALVPAETLGLISIAGVFSWGLGSILQKLNVRVVFPSLAEKHRISDAAHTKAIHKFQLRALSTFVPGFLFISLISTPLIDFLYDDRYQLVGHYLGIMSINGALSILPTIYNNAFLSEGKSFHLARIAFISAVLRISCSLIGFDLHGIDGMILGGGVASILLYLVTLYTVRGKGWVVLKTDLSVLGLILAFSSVKIF